MLRFPRPVQYLSASEDGFGWTMESAPHVVSYPALRGACVLVRAFWFSLHGTSLRTPLSILYCSFYDPKNRQNKTFARRVDVSVPPFAESDEVCKDADLRLAHQTPHQLWTELNSYIPPFAVDLLIFLSVYVPLFCLAALSVSRMIIK